MSREDFKLPILRIVQQQSHNAPEGSAGHFLNSITNTASQYLLAVVLRVNKTRILWPRDFGADSQPLCASDDSLIPRPQFVATAITDWLGFKMGGVQIPSKCEACPLKEWPEDIDKPPCALSYKYVIVDLESGMPGLLNLSRTAVGMARALNTLLVTGGLKKLRLGTELVESDKGRWYAFRYSVVGRPEPEDWEVIKAVAPMARDVVISAEVGAEDLEEQPYRGPGPGDEIPF
jgi:hypothetical protein